MKFRNRVFASGAAIAVLLSTNACFPPAHRRLEVRPEEGEGTLHAVQNERLREVMQGFNNLMFEQMYTELELDVERVRRSRKIAESAAELAKTTEYLPRYADELGLSPSEKALFLERADELRAKAVRLQEAAEGKDANAMRHWLMRLEITCNNCHRLFRGPRSQSGHP